MLVIPVKEGEQIDRALKRLKRKFLQTGTLKKLREKNNILSLLKEIELRCKRLPILYLALEKWSRIITIFITFKYFFRIFIKRFL